MENITPDQNMTTSNAPQPKSSLPTILIIILILLLGFVGWWLFSTNSPTSTVDDSSGTAVPEIDSNADLNKDSTTNFLTDASIDAALDTSEIDSALGN
ncbi:MAG: hypothetical protein WD970_00860 [Patescibacteria group bacterium]